MAFSPNQITREHILNAVNKIEVENLPLIPSTKYEVIVDEKRYPPKEIMRYAHEQFNGEKIWFNTGGKPTNQFLEKLGFKIVNKISNNTPILNLIEDYKTNLKETRLKDEIYKWQLISKFSGRPNLEADNLHAELKSINYANLMFHTAKAVSLHLAQETPTEYRQQLKNLFDENISIKERVENFISETLRIYRELESFYGNHHDERTTSAFLTFYNPDKYTFFKDSFYKKYCSFIGVPAQKKGHKYAHYLELVNDLINEYLAEDAELIQLVDEITDSFQFKDSNRLLLAQDFLYQTFDKSSSDSVEVIEYKQNFWIYAPGENARYWDEFYEKGIMAIGWNFLGDLKNYESQKEIETELQKFENTTTNQPNNSLANYQFCNEIAIGDIVIIKRGKSECLGYGIVTSDYFFDETPHEYQSRRQVNWINKGVWDARHINLPTKTLTNITRYTEDVEKLKKLLGIDEQIETPPKIIANMPLNQILYGPPGTGKTFNSIEKAVEIIIGEIKSTHYENKVLFDELRQNGQIEFVTFHQNYTYEDFVVGIFPDVSAGVLRFDKREGIFKKLVEKAKKNWLGSRNNPTIKPNFQTVFNKYFAQLFEEEIPFIEIPMRSKGHKFKITLIDSENGKIKFTKQSGGTGHDLLTRNVEAIYNGDLNYGLEGLGVYYYPLIDELKRFAANMETEKAQEELKNFVLIIDEINRANISRVFGELITLLEDDKRLGAENELKVTLPNGEKEFGIPPNLFILGTMNTADKSIALIDVALRRRFEFVGFYPDYSILENLGKIESAKLLKTLNAAIYQKKGSADYLIGHAYFLKNEKIEKTLEKRILPLLMEYFAGKTEIICQLFSETDWVINYDSERYSWQISKK